jgi:hypothetical protein
MHVETTEHPSTPVSAGIVTGGTLFDAIGGRASPSSPPSAEVAGSNVSKSCMHAGIASADEIETATASVRGTLRSIRTFLGCR